MVGTTSTDQLPEPKYGIEMSSCSFQKTHCVEGKCSCSVNGLTCTNLCKCDDCHNVETGFTAVEEPETERSDDDQENPDDKTRSLYDSSDDEIETNLLRS